MTTAQKEAQRRASRAEWKIMGYGLTILLILALVFGVFFLFGNIARGDVPITRAEAENIPAIPLKDITTKFGTLTGKLIRARFTSRGTAFETAKDGTFWGSVRSADGWCEVIVPPEGIEWFKRLPVGDGSEPPSKFKTLAVFAKPAFRKRSARSNEVQCIELVGLEFKSDLKGPRIVW